MTNFLTPRKAITAIATLTLMSAASAMAADVTTPAQSQNFEIATTTNGKVRLANSAYKDGNYKRSAAFLESALNSKMSKRRAAIAYSNLCASYGQMGELELATEACDTALELRPGYAPAETNREALTVKLVQK